MKSTVKNLCTATAGCLALSCSLNAADWPAYRGPDGNGISSEKILTQWPQTGPKQVWKLDTPNGFSSFSVADGKVFTLVLRNNEEICLAADANTGKELWTAKTGPGKYDSGGDSGASDNKGGDGPRSTPAVDGGKVYIYTPALLLHCLDSATGKTVWTKDIAKEFQGRNIGWKNATSPLIDGDLLYVAGGGQGQSIIAFNKASGQVAWKAHDEKLTHATPVAGTILGARQVVFFLQSGLLSVDAKTGAALWRFPFRYNVSTAASPVIAGDIVYCSAGYGVGGGACKITKTGNAFTASQLYKIEGDKQIANHWSTPVHKDGYLYGMFSFKQYANGPLKCVEVATGKVMWTQAGFGAGNAILVGNHVVALADDGHVALVEANPAAFKQVARHKAVQGKCWSTPAVANGKLYVRSTKEGVCLDVAQQQALEQ